MTVNDAVTPGTTRTSPARERLRIVAAGAVAVAVVAALFVVLYTGHAKGVYGKAWCYYDGRYHDDCPMARSGPGMDTAWVYAAVIDSFYFGRVRSAPANRWLVAAERETSTGDQRGVGAGPLEDAIARAGAPRELAARYLAANARPSRLGTLWTVPGRQVFFDSAAAERFFTRDPKAEDPRAALDEHVPPAGLLTLSRVGFDRARQWALVYAAVRGPDRGGVDAYVLLRRTDEAGWWVWKLVAPPRPAPPDRPA